MMRWSAHRQRALEAVDDSMRTAARVGATAGTATVFLPFRRCQARPARRRIPDRVAGSEGSVATTSWMTARRLESASLASSVRNALGE